MKYRKKTIELLLDRADSKPDFKVAKYMIDDCVSRGYEMSGMYELFHRKYKVFLNKDYQYK